MIRMPEASSELARTRHELDRQDAEVADMIATNDVVALTSRPTPNRWSVAEHLVHLSLANGPYLRLMKAAAREAHENGWIGGEEPWPSPLLGRFMIWFMEPPPRLRTRTLKAMDPAGADAPPMDFQIARRDFDRVQEAFRDLLEGLPGVDLGRAEFVSPFAGWLKLNVAQGIRFLLAHNRRHLWLCREALEQLGRAEGRR